MLGVSVMKNHHLTLWPSYDDYDDDDDTMMIDDDMYIMMQSLSVCNEKSSLPIRPR